MKEQSKKGLVSRVESKDYYIYSIPKQDLIRCSLRGKFKKEFNLKKDKLYHTDVAVVGDIIEYELNNDGTGVIKKIHKRKNYLSRKAPRIRGASHRGERLEQIVAANIDNVFIITSFTEPKFNNRVVDRFIVACESSHLNTIIVINKSDLKTEENIEEWKKLYEDIGYRVLLTSAETGEGLKELKSLFNGKKSLLWGQSGVGKSSILNKIFPDLNLKTGSISNYTFKGTHTTVTSNSIFVDKETLIIDTPGIREIDPFGIRKEDLSHYFIEFNQYAKDCRFNTCTHHHEPGCEVLKAVNNEKISPFRYDSYLRILETVEEDINF